MARLKALLGRLSNSERELRRFIVEYLDRLVESGSMALAPFEEFPESYFVSRLHCLLGMVQGAISGGLQPSMSTSLPRCGR